MQTNIYLRDTELAKRFCVSRGSIWRWAADGRFPKPVCLTEGCTRWRASDVAQWEAARAGEPVVEAVG